MTLSSQNSFNDLYSKYSGVLSNIVSKQLQNHEQLDVIVKETFVELFEKDLVEENRYCMCSALVKIAMQKIALLEKGNRLIQSSRNNSSLYHQLLFGSQTVQGYCDENKLTQKQAQDQIRGEFNQLRDIHSQKAKIRKLTFALNPSLSGQAIAEAI